MRCYHKLETWHTVHMSFFLRSSFIQTCAFTSLDYRNICGRTAIVLLEQIRIAYTQMRTASQYGFAI